MNANEKELSNPFSTGGGGVSFENAIQAKFVTLMLTGGYAPCLPHWPIIEIKLQGKVAGYNTDDVIVIVGNPNNNEKIRLLGQIKHSIQITEKNKIFEEVIQAAWNDFNDPNNFKRGKDVIALITGPISKTDIDGVTFLLEQARHTKDASEFLTQVDRANFSSNNTRKKRDAFRVQLNKANKGAISDDDFYEFLKHFYLLGYDLDRKGSIISSLLKSHIAQFDNQLAYEIWCKIVCEVQQYNQNAGTITLDRLPEEIKKHFERPVLSYIPSQLASQASLPKSSYQPTVWNKHDSADKLAFVNLIGSWDERNDYDRKAVEQIIGGDYDVWIADLRNILTVYDSPLTYKNGVWTVKKRKELWADLGLKIFDDYLERFKQAATHILKTDDPAFELPTDKRYMANIYNKSLPNSENIRQGVSETLALLKNDPESLINCSDYAAITVANVIVNEVLIESDWLRWGSLNGLLPNLSEASPEVFLKAVESSIEQSPSPFEELFNQESTGSFGQTYLTGLLWALEGIAWDEKYLTRVSVALAEFAAIDPGSNWINRPINSLINIFLPWHPQTQASVEKRQVAVRTICNEQAEIGWSLLLGLLPKENSYTTGTHKPKWRNDIAEDWQPNVSRDEYLKQNVFYSELLVSMAERDINRLTILVGKLDQLSLPAFNKFKDILISKQVLTLPEDQRVILWNELINFVSRHRKYQDADWAIDEEFLEPLEGVAKKLAPTNIKLLHKRLFINRDMDLYEGQNDWDTEHRKLYDKRLKAINEILEESNLQGVLNFVDDVSEIKVIGKILAEIDDGSFDSQLLPNMLVKSDAKNLELIASYSYFKHHNNGWQWFDSLDKSEWSNDQVALLLSIMPFEKNTWDRAKQLLGNDDSMYWMSTNANTIGTTDNIEYAVKRLLEANRPHIALQSIRTYLFYKREMSMDIVCEALLDLASSEGLIGYVSTYDIIEVIKILQKDLSIGQSKLIQVEWAYLGLLGKYSEGAPINLENALATDPDFFCTMLQYAYKPKESDKQDPIEDKSVAINAYNLLSNWVTIPGSTTDKGFDIILFKQWLEAVKNITRTSGHYDIAMIVIGKVLCNAPKGENLWIDPDVANILNQKDHENMRNGYRTAVYNSRGAHCVDPEAKPEKALSEKYSQQADDVEELGYFRLATTLRSLSGEYRREAEKILKNGGSYF